MASSCDCPGSLQLCGVTQRAEWKKSPQAFRAGMISKLLKREWLAIRFPPLSACLSFSCASHNAYVWESKRPLQMAVLWLEIHRAQSTCHKQYDMAAWSV